MSSPTSFPSPVSRGLLARLVALVLGGVVAAALILSLIHIYLEFIEVHDHERRKIGPFEVEFIPVTHSVPSAHALAFHTKVGIVVHSGDFKLDLTPIDNRRTDVARK